MIQVHEFPAYPLSVLQLSLYTKPTSQILFKLIDGWASLSWLVSLNIIDGWLKDNGLLFCCKWSFCDKQTEVGEDDVFKDKVSIYFFLKLFSHMF